MDRPERGRRPTSWDLVGLMTATTIMLAAHLIATAVIDEPIGHITVVPWATALAGGAAVALLIVLIARDRPRLADVPRLLTDVWRDPPGSWVAAVTGGLLALPLFGLYVPVLLSDADSARIVAAVEHVRTHGIGFILDTQDNLLPYVVMGPAVALGGLAGAKAVSIASVLVLAAVVSYITRRITGSTLGGAASALALLALPPAIDRAGYVPMYPTMLALGYLGAWLAARAITERERPWALALTAGACLALAPEAQALGVLFLAAPVVLLTLARDLRHGLVACGRIYLAVLAVSLPRIAVNLASGGFERLTSYRTDFWITQGYVGEIQRRFWGYAGVSEPLGEYVTRLPGRFVETLDERGAVLLTAAVLAWLFACRGRGRLLVLAVVGTFALSVIVKQVPPFPRYYSPLWPGIVILVGVGVAALARRASRTSRVATAGAVLGLAVLAGSTLAHVTNQHARRVEVVDARPYAELAQLIDDDRGVIGARSHALMNVTTGIPTWGGQFLSEDEYVTYLTWPSDDEVVDLLQRHDIGWVIINEVRQLEIGYHDTWLIPHHHARARQVERVAVSPAFCKVADMDGFLLYRLGACAEPAPDPAGSLTAP